METPIILRNDKNKIKCSKHDLRASYICLEEKCPFYLNCIKCEEEHIKFHKNSIDSNFILNDIFDDDLIEELFELNNFDLESKKEILKEMIVNFKKKLIKECEKIEKFFLIYLENDSKEKKLIKQKKILNQTKEKFKNHKNNLNKLFELGKEFKNFFVINKSKKILSTNLILKLFSEKINMIENEITKSLKSESFFINLNKNLFFQNSLLIKTDEEKKFINNKLFENRLKEIKLIYRGSENGFNKTSFKNNCYNKGPCIVFIKSQYYQKIFGGYNSVGWFNSNNNNTNQYTRNSFIFSLTEKIKLKCKNDNKSVGYNNYNLFRFGHYNNNADLAIYQNCNQNNESYSNLGHYYELPSEGFAFNSNQSQSFLAGAYNFGVEEIEVYTVVLG